MFWHTVSLLNSKFKVHLMSNKYALVMVANNYVGVAAGWVLINLGITGLVK